jgi:hypothetical protein
MFNITRNCERLACPSTLEEGMNETATKGNDMMTLNEDDRRLTPTQRDIRDRNASLPKHLRRSIDRYRVARGMVPLWGVSLERERKRR